MTRSKVLTEILQIRVSPALLEQLRETAAAESIPLTALVRQAISQHLRRLEAGK